MYYQFLTMTADSLDSWACVLRDKAYKLNNGGKNGKRKKRSSKSTSTNKSRTD